MSETRKLTNPHAPEDPCLSAQLTEIFTQAAKDSGGFVVDHPEEHTFVVVFGAHQCVVTTTQR